MPNQVMLFFLLALSALVRFATTLNQGIKCPPIRTCGWELMELGKPASIFHRCYANSSKLQACLLHTWAMYSPIKQLIARSALLKQASQNTAPVSSNAETVFGAAATAGIDSRAGAGSTATAENVMVTEPKPHVADSPSPAN